MKIGFVTFEYPPPLVGGAGTYAKYITKELANLGCEVHVIVPSTHASKEELEKNLTIHRIKCVDFPYLSAFLSALRLRRSVRDIDKKTGGLDVIHLSGQHAFQLILQFTPNRVLNRPHIMSIHALSYQSITGEHPSPLQRMMDRGENSYFTELAEKLILKKADLLVANSNYTKQILTSVYGIPSSNIKVIYMGYPTIFCRPEDYATNEKKRIASSIGIDDEPVILFVGRLVKRKRTPNLLRAAKELRKRAIGFKLLVVGRGPEEQDCIRTAHALGLDEDVTFLGFVDESTLRSIYEMSDIVTVPSTNEPLGIVLLEAMAASKPIIASRTGGIPEIIKDHQNGILVDPSNSEEYADALEYLIRNRDTRISIGETNYRKICEQFTWKKSAEELLSSYKALIKK